MAATVKVTPHRCNLIPSCPDPDSESPQQWQHCCDGGRPYCRSLLLYRRNNRLKIFLFIFFRESERGEAARIENGPFGISYPGLAGLSKRTSQMWF